MECPPPCVLRLSGVRVANAVCEDATLVACAPWEMVAAARDHWMPIFPNDSGEDAGKDVEAECETAKMGFLAMEPPTLRDAREVLRPARRTAPGPDGVPYAVWRRSGDGGAETLCMLVHGFGNGMSVPRSAPARASTCGPPEHGHQGRRGGSCAGHAAVGGSRCACIAARARFAPRPHPKGDRARLVCTGVPQHCRRGRIAACGRAACGRERLRGGVPMGAPAMGAYGCSACRRRWCAGALARWCAWQT